MLESFYNSLVLSGIQAEQAKRTALWDTSTHLPLPSSLFATWSQTI